MGQRIATLILSLILIAGVLAACGGRTRSLPDEPPTVPAVEGPSGAELVEQMQAAIDNTDSVYFNAHYTVSTVANSLEGTAAVWGERPGKSRVEVTSEAESLNGVVIGSNGERSWAYNPEQNTLYISDDDLHNAQLRDQPELRVMLELGEIIRERRFEDTQATNLGVEPINGRACYRVAVEYEETDANTVNLAGLTATFWIDMETSLPHQIGIRIERDEAVGNGMLSVTGNLETDIDIEPSRFDFIPPADEEIITIDLNQDLPRPGELSIPDDLIPDN